MLLTLRVCLLNLLFSGERLIRSRFIRLIKYRKCFIAANIFIGNASAHVVQYSIMIILETTYQYLNTITGHPNTVTQ